MEELKRAIELRESGKVKEANEMLVELADKHPKDAQVNYQCAWSFDVMELETQAIPYYEKAISLGLAESELHGAYLGLGSTYRTIGEYQKSKEVFEKALERFEKDKVLETFYAMTLYNLKEHSKAMEILLLNIAKTSSDEGVGEYKKAIEFYSDKLDRIF